MYKGDSITIGWNENANDLGLFIQSAKKQITKTKTIVIPCEDSWYNDWVKVAIITSFFWVLAFFFIRKF